MCPQVYCRKHEWGKSRLLATATYTGTRDVHWHLEKHHLAWTEEVADKELHFNWMQSQHRSLTQYSAMIRSKLEIKTKQTKSQNLQHFGDTEFSSQGMILIEENHGMAGVFPPAIEGDFCSAG